MAGCGRGHTATGKSPGPGAAREPRSESQSLRRHTGLPEAGAMGVCRRGRPATPPHMRTRPGSQAEGLSRLNFRHARRCATNLSDKPEGCPLASRLGVPRRHSVISSTEATNDTVTGAYSRPEIMISSLTGTQARTRRMRAAVGPDSARNARVGARRGGW